MKFFKNYFWTIVISLAAVSLAFAAAYFSITGLSKLFAGAPMQIIIMASIIEFSKIAMTAALHKFWSSINKALRFVYVGFVVFIMVLTSIGVYGFLADAYSSTSLEMDKIGGEIELMEKQKEQKLSQIESINEIKLTKSNRISSLIELRSQQEARVDSLYSKGWYNSARTVQRQIEASSAEVTKIQTEVDSLVSRVNVIESEIGELDIKVLELNNNDVAADLASLKYISKVFEIPMEEVVNYFIVLIMIVFDPMAVLLVIFAGNIYEKARENLVKTNVDTKKEDSEKEESEEDLEAGNTEVQGVDEKLQEDSEEYFEKQESMYGPDENDAVNDAVEEEIHNYGYDFIENDETEGVKEYVSGKDGEFKLKDSDSSLNSMLKGIDSNPMFLYLLDVIFENGNKKKGDKIPSYKNFVKDIEGSGVKVVSKNENIDSGEKVVKEDDVIDFIKICNLLSITDMRKENDMRFLKDYEESKGIISLLSK